MSVQQSKEVVPMPGANGGTPRWQLIAQTKEPLRSVMSDLETKSNDTRIVFKKTQIQ